MKNALFLAAVALGAVALSAAPARADDKPAPPPRNPGTTDNAGSGSDLKGTTTRGTTTSGTTTTGQTRQGMTLSGTTTRAGSGTAAGMTVGTSRPGTPGAARAGAAAMAAGHGANRFWNETYSSRGLAGRRTVLAAPAGVLVVSAEPTPAGGPANGTVRAPDATPSVAAPVTPTSYVEPAPRERAVYGDSSSRTWHGPASGAFAGARLGRGSFGGIGTYSGYETWGPVGIAGGCDCR